MSDENTTTKVEAEAAEAEELENSEELLSLESLDNIIADEDPEFSAALGEIGPEVNLESSIYDEGLALEYTLEEEKRRWNDGSPLKTKLLKFFPFLPEWSFKIKMRRTAFRLSMAKEKERFLHFIKNLWPLTKQGLGAVKASLAAKLAAGGSAFRGFSKLKKIAFVSLLLVTLPLLFVVFLAVRGLLVAPPEDLFIGSLTEISDQSFAVSEVGQQESFYDSPRIAQNMLLMRRMVVNIQRSVGSGPNPMGAFEFYIEGTGNEVLIEIKDREAEVEDLFARTAEELSYDQLESADGKRLLCDRLRKEVNRILTQGLVRRVFIKTAIIKP